jgi:hypothetical protein
MENSFMKASNHLFVCLMVLLGTGAALAQVPTDPAYQRAASAASPVAYVYVAKQTHIQGFAVASNGRLTSLPGAPVMGSVSAMALNQKYLFGVGDNGADIYSYAIAADGTLNLVATTNVRQYDDCGIGLNLLTIDPTGSTLYTTSPGCSGNAAFKIDQGNGQLQFVGTGTQEFGYSKLVLLGNDQYAYELGCSVEDTPENFALRYQRQGDGFLTLLNDNPVPMPPASDPHNDYYCPTVIGHQPWEQDLNSAASDGTNHLAIAVQDFSLETFAFKGPVEIATYTADAQGNLTTNSTWSNMVQTAQQDTVSAMSISPTGQLLAAGAQGFQVFHFNGGAQATAYTALRQVNDQLLQFGWDADNHLYALSPGQLRVYTATPTSVTEDPGSPVSIPDASSIVVLPLTH